MPAPASRRSDLGVDVGVVGDDLGEGGQVGADRASRAVVGSRGVGVQMRMTRSSGVEFDGCAFGPKSAWRSAAGDLGDFAGGEGVPQVAVGPVGDVGLSGDGEVDAERLAAFRLGLGVRRRGLPLLRRPGRR